MPVLRGTRRRPRKRTLSTGSCATLIAASCKTLRRWCRPTPRLRHRSSSCMTVAASNLQPRHRAAEEAALQLYVVRGGRDGLDPKRLSLVTAIVAHFFLSLSLSLQLRFYSNAASDSPAHAPLLFFFQSTVAGSSRGSRRSVATRGSVTRPKQAATANEAAAQYQASRGAAIPTASIEVSRAPHVHTGRRRNTHFFVRVALVTTSSSPPPVWAAGSVKQPACKRACAVAANRGLSSHLKPFAAQHKQQ